MNELLKSHTFGKQTVTLEKMKSGLFRVKSFGELKGIYRTFKDELKAKAEYGCIRLNIVAHYLGREVNT